LHLIDTFILSRISLRIKQLAYGSRTNVSQISCLCKTEEYKSKYYSFFSTDILVLFPFYLSGTRL